MADIYSIFYTLESSGFYEYLLPFLLVFVIVFAILEKTYIFGKEGDAPKTNINVVVGFLIGLLIVTQTDLIYFMNMYLSRMAFFIVLAVMIMLVFAMVVEPKRNKPAFAGLPTWGAIIIAVIALLWSLSSSAYGLDFPYWYYLSDSTVSTLLALGILALIVWIVAFSGKRKSERTLLEELARVRAGRN